MPVVGEERYRELLLCLATPRAARDLLYAPASRAARNGKPSQSPGFIYSHVAEGIEIACVVEGVTRIATPVGVFRLTPGKLLLIDRGVHHAELAGIPGRGHWIFWCHLLRAAAYIDYTGYAPSRPLDSPGLLLRGRTDVESVGAAIASELATPSWHYEDAVAALLTYLSCILVRRLSSDGAVPASTAEPPVISGDPRTWQVIHEALEFCEASFRKGVTRADVAKAVGYSPGHLGHLISSRLGRSLSDHLRDLRIDEGRYLLESTELSIQEVAHAVGYKDPAHFTRAFRRVTGISPSSYRLRSQTR